MRFVLALMAAWLAFSPLPAVAQTSALSELYVNERYDPRADPYRDLERALDVAAAKNRRVLIVVGGNWCGWCEILDRFLVVNADVRAAFEASFVALKVNRSRQNLNRTFLSGFPESGSYPDFFILDANGDFLAQQRTDQLHHDSDFDRARMLAFARRWRAP